MPGFLHGSRYRHPCPLADRARDGEGETVQFFQDVLGERKSESGAGTVRPHAVGLVEPVEYERELFRRNPGSRIDDADFVFPETNLDFPVFRSEFFGVPDDVPDGDFEKFPVDVPLDPFRTDQGYPRILLREMPEQRFERHGSFFHVHFPVGQEQERLDYRSEMEYLGMCQFDFLFGIFQKEREFQGARDSEEAVLELVGDIGTQVLDFSRFRADPGKQCFELAGNPDEFVAFLAGNGDGVEGGILFQPETLDGADDVPDRSENSPGKKPADHHDEQSQEQRAGKQVAEHELMGFDRVGNVIDEEDGISVEQPFRNDEQAESFVFHLSVVRQDRRRQFRENPFVIDDFPIRGDDPEIVEIPRRLRNAHNVRDELRELLVLLVSPIPRGLEIEHDGKGDQKRDGETDERPENLRPSRYGKRAIFHR